MRATSTLTMDKFIQRYNNSPELHRTNIQNGFIKKGESCCSSPSFLCETVTWARQQPPPRSVHSLPATSPAYPGFDVEQVGEVPDAVEHRRF